ncbi:hypothetical protein B0A55_02391 [Friedmanniomyces simplex]|uniref:Methyltransferase type 11 domain-containing protein n=1 Tax=Friedmanniomyces simplex TaxID=329884 RepID=A0A4U0XW88_9PEZI|nr:hypothetical protein B0A55_02391 [Friedmanniomyces simplex]
MSTTAESWPVKQYHPRHTTWPYDPSDFSTQDPSSDSGFYSTPRLVTHIDDAAIATLREYYDTVLPRKGRILDFCSSWVSHYPPAVEEAAASGELKVIGLGMNKAELDANKVLNTGRVLVDLNTNPDIAAALQEAKLIASSTNDNDDESERLDASTNVVSTDYLTNPVPVLESLHTITKSGGTVHLTISNRCFPTKAINRWLRVSEEERLLMIGDYLHFAGWREIEIVELSNGKVEQAGGEGGGEAAAGQGGGLQSLMGWMGMGRRDPLWVVRATKG